MLYSGTHPESYITKYTLVCEENVANLNTRSRSRVAGTYTTCPVQEICRGTSLIRNSPPRRDIRGFLRMTQGWLVRTHVKKILYSGTDPESYITKYTLVYEDKVTYFRPISGRKWLHSPLCGTPLLLLSSLTSNLSKNDQLLTTHRSPSTGNRDPLQTCGIPSQPAVWHGMGSMP